MKPDWQKAEDKVARLIGGSITPGSGNKHTRGDAINKNKRVVEVKQTSKPNMTIQKKWLDTLESLEGDYEVALAIFFGQTGYVYYPIGGSPSDTKWSTLSVKENELPPVIKSSKQTWELDHIDSLKDWKDP